MEENKYKQLFIIYKEKCLDFFKYRFVSAVKQQKLLSSAVGGIILIIGLILFIPGATKDNSQTNITSNASQSQTSGPDEVNQSENSQTSSGQNPNKKTPTPHLISSSQSSRDPSDQHFPVRVSTGPTNQSVTQAKTSTITTNPTNNPSTAKSQTSQSSSQGSQGGSSQSQSSGTSQSSSSQTTSTNGPPQLVFIGPGGQSQPYTEPDTPPVEVTWNVYQSSKDHYAIEYPSNWQLVTRDNQGHEQLFVYTPDADPNDPSAQYVSFGWASTFTPPTASYTGSFVLDGVPGTLYTNGSIGSTYIAAMFQYVNGYLVLNNNISSEVFAYIFNHMLLSIDFFPS